MDLATYLLTETEAEVDAFDDPTERELTPELAALLPADLPPLSDAEAHAVIRRLARIEDEKMTLRANCEALVRGLDHQRDAVLFRVGEQLQAWTAAQLRGRRRSVRTLHGVAGFRSQRAHVRITDPVRAIEWAREHCPEAITENVVAKHIRAEVFAGVDETTGEHRYTAPVGFEVTPDQERFYVKSGAVRTETEESGE